MLAILSRSVGPITGGELSSRLGVSRQVIVQDVAMLRAAGTDILATPQGYLLAGKIGRPAYREVIACVHTRDEIEEELNILVDHGVRVRDVIVEHPVYGELRGMLMVESREDVVDLVRRLRTTEPLSTLTKGVHLHTVEANRTDAIAHACSELAARGFLLDGSPTLVAIGTQPGH
jgi:transcriptional regulator of NAD metabolism